MRDACGDDLLDNLGHAPGHASPEGRTPFVHVVPSRLKEIRRVERPTGSSEVRVTERVVRERREQVLVVHAIRTQPGRYRGTME